MKWKDIENDFLAGVKRRDICRKYGCNYHALDSHIKTHKLVSRRDNIKEETSRIVAEKAADEILEVKKRWRKDAVLFRKAYYEQLTEDGKLKEGLTANDISALSHVFRRVIEVEAKAYDIPELRYTKNEIVNTEQFAENLEEFFG